MSPKGVATLRERFLRAVPAMTTARLRRVVFPASASGPACDFWQSLPQDRRTALFNLAIDTAAPADPRVRAQERCLRERARDPRTSKAIDATCAKMYLEKPSNSSCTRSSE